MKKIIIYIVTFILFGFSFYANAALINNGNGTITDTDTNLMWLQDANYAYTQYIETGGVIGDSDGLMNWDAANNWAIDLSYAGYDDWRLPEILGPDPSCSRPAEGPRGYNCTNSEMGHLYHIELGNPVGGPLVFTSPFTNLQAYYYASSEYTIPTNAWSFGFGNGYQNDDNKSVETYALAVRVVPEPISSILFIAGGSLLAGRGYIKRKNRT